MRVQYRFFESVFSSWKAVFQEAAEFASTIAPDRLIDISHSCDKSISVVCVWYWDDEPVAEK